MRASLLALIAVAAVTARHVQQPSRDWNRQPGYPAVKIRLTKKGINHLKSVGVKLLNEQISQLSGYSTSFNFQQPGLDGSVQLSGVRVLQYNPPQVSVVNFLPPRFVVIGLENMDVSLVGSFFATAGPFQVEGTVDGTLVGMTVALTTEFSSTVDGLMAVQVQNCSTIIHRSHFNINPHGPLGPLVKTLEGSINDNIRQRIPSMFCRKLKHLIEDNSPRVFARLARTNFGEHFKDDITDNTVIKRNIQHPIVTYDYFETQQKGEVRYEENDEPTPFFPLPMQTNMESDRMLYFFASDYLFNSLLYHAYQTNKLNLELNKDNLPDKYRGLVSTSCAGGGLLGSVCVGKLIPAISERFPNTTTSFVLIPHGLPEFEFNGDAGAITLSSRILTYVDENGQKRQIMVSSADGQADVMLTAAEGRLNGELKLNKLAVRLHRSALAVDPSSIEQLTPLAKTFIGPQLNQALKKGIPFPLKDSITFIQPNLKIHEGFVELGTDFILSEDALRKKVKETFSDIHF